MRMRRPPETDAKRHHHTPVSYIRRFSSDGKHVFALNRVTGAVQCVTPENVAVEKEFNTLVSRDGKKERWPEAQLASLDGTVKPLLDKLERGETLSCEERWYVSFFIGFGETRGGGFREEIHASGSHDRLEAALRGEVEAEIDDDVERRRFEEAFAAVTGVWLDVRAIVAMAREDMAHVASGAANIAAMASVGFELAQYIFYAGWVCVAAPSGSEFVTSDRPLGLWRTSGGPATDPFERGVLKLFPLSRSTALIIGDVAGEPFTMTQVIDIPLVRLANAAVARRSYRFVIGSSEALLNGVASDADRLASAWR